MATFDYATSVWVCTDCNFAAHGLWERDEPAPEIDPRTWFAESGVEIFPGLPVSEHECGWNGEGEMSCEGECERDEFSSRECGRCGTHLAGGREAWSVFYVR